VAIDFRLAPSVMSIVERTSAFVRTHVLPIEDALGGVADAGGEDLRVSLQDAARAAGVFCPHGPIEYGGLGLGMSDRAAVFEEAGYSLFGPLALNCAAPDEGNMHLLEVVATGEQRERFLAPLVRGEIRSSFAMTEPPPGAGADPSALSTTAVRVGDRWQINGRKVFFTGADGAGFFIVMARTSGVPGDRGGATMFLVDAAICRICAFTWLWPTSSWR
jgi:acyl-CoA dehydrogenase